MEPDFHRHFQRAAIVSTTRILLRQVTREAELQMLEELPRAAGLIKTAAPDAVVFGCTSAGSLEGLAHDARIRQMIEQETGAKTFTVLQAVLLQLSTISPKNIAVCTPYREDLTGSVARCIAEGGYAIVKAVGMGLRENLDIGRVTPPEIVRFVESNLGGTTADCLFLSCTNWRAVEAINLLRSKLGIPVISSNQAAIAAVQQATAAGI